MEKPIHPNLMPPGVAGKVHADKNGKAVIGYDYVKEPGKSGRKIYYFADGTETIEDDQGKTLTEW